MAKRDFFQDDLSWLTLADRYVAEAQAEWVATMAMKTSRADMRKSRKTRALEVRKTSNHLALADFHIAATEKRLAHQATLIGHLAASRHDTSQADDQFWVMGQLLDAMRERRQLMADGEDGQGSDPSAGSEDLPLSA